MYQALKDSLFLFIPLVASLTLSGILTFLYFKDKNLRKLVFAIGLFLSGLGFYAPLVESLGGAAFFPNGEWLFVPMALAVAIAALSSLFKIQNFKGPFIVFMVGTLAALAIFFAQFPFAYLRLGLMILFMGTSVPILIYIFYKSRDSADLNFLIATICFLFEGVVMDLGTSVDIPVMLSLFGEVFIAFMFHRPDAVNPSSLPSFIVLEKKLEEANQSLQKMEERLLKAERLAAIGELAGIIGHDLRNPLQGIRSATYYLKTQKDNENNPNCREMLEVIDDCIERSDKIINDLIEYSQVINLQPSTSNPKTLLMRSLSLLQAPVGIEIVNKATTEPTLILDSNRIERAFAGIIKNAFDAMPEGGKLTITSKKAVDYVIFNFRDTGVGMDRDTLEKLWTPLFTTKAKGMGFGLPNCKRIVEAHGGKIIMESELWTKGRCSRLLCP